jgi:hypothetical protein
MAQHKSLTPEAGLASLRETGSNFQRGLLHTPLLCDEPHVLFNNALLYSDHRFRAQVSFQA